MDPRSGIVNNFVTEGCGRLKLTASLFGQSFAVCSLQFATSLRNEEVNLPASQKEVVYQIIVGRDFLFHPIL